MTWRALRDEVATVLLVQGEDNDDADGPTALMHRDALAGLLDKTSERHAPHTVSRELLRARGGPHHVEIIDVAPIDPTRPRSDLDEVEPELSPMLVLGILALLVTVFIAVTQLG